MPDIDDPSNTRSVFPTGLDTWTSYVNGVSAASVIDAETWNKLTSGLLRAQRHNQKIVHFFDSADRKRIALSGITTLGAPAAGFTQTFTLTAAQLSLLNNQLQYPINMFNADAFRLDGSTDCGCEVHLTTTQVKVLVRPLDITGNLPAGDYLVRLTIFGH
jgi:hypothetical protein